MMSVEDFDTVRTKLTDFRATEMLLLQVRKGECNVTIGGRYMDSSDRFLVQKARNAVENHLTERLVGLRGELHALGLDVPLP